MSSSVARPMSALPDTLRVERSAEALERWSVAGRRPSAVAFPESVDELAEVLGRASEEGWAVVPAGAGTWLEGGGPPAAVDLVVSTRRLGDVYEYEPDDLTVTAGAGVALARLAERTAAHGQWLPQDPVAGPEATLGAFVATGLPGPLVAGYGRPRDHLLGLTVVTGDGRVVRPGGRVVKNVAGFDLVRPLAGSWGTLAVVAGVSLRLYPLPERDVTLLFPESDASRLVERARAVATADVVPAAAELVGAGWLPSGGTGSPDAEGGVGRDGPLDHDGPALVVRVLGSADEVEGALDLLPGARDAQVRLEGERSAALHRRTARWSRPTGTLVLRLALPPARLGRLLELADPLVLRAARDGARTGWAVHVTRGVLRLAVEFDPAVGDSGGGASESAPSASGSEVEPAAEGAARGRTEAPDGWTGALTELRATLEGEGGSLSVVAGPPGLVEDVGPTGDSGAAGRLMQGLKETFDPDGVLAPGRWSAGAPG